LFVHEGHVVAFSNVQSRTVIERMGPFSRSRYTWALVALVASLAWFSFETPPVRAEALVSVQLKDAQGQPAEGQVTLRDAEGKAIASCEARAGKCEMQNVPGGNFTVTVQPARGNAPKPRKVVIPPRGKVALVVTSG
jgi:hypothetical protein